MRNCQKPKIITAVKMIVSISTPPDDDDSSETEEKVEFRRLSLIKTHSPPLHCSILQRVEIPASLDICQVQSC